MHTATASSSPASVAVAGEPVYDDLKESVSKNGRTRRQVKRKEYDDDSEISEETSSRKPKKRVKKKKNDNIKTEPDNHILKQKEYSVRGSIVDVDSEEEDEVIDYHGRPLDKATLQQAARDWNTWNQERLEEERDAQQVETEEDDEDAPSIFGQRASSLWIECSRCKKWRRLRGVVNEKKLPAKWFCSMNKGDPERARCSAPEEEYKKTAPQSLAEARVRKHLRVWVRRIQTNEAYEARMPTLTRGKKKASSCNDPYQWLRCSSPLCGKWRSLLRCMDAKSVIEQLKDGEWYCFMNTWDEKNASCAAPQENIPTIGCPPWVLQDDPGEEGGDR